MKYLPLTITSIALSVSFLPGADTADKVGSANDDHGNITWRSSAMEMKEEWKYSYSATNRSEDYRCRFRWDIPGLAEINTTLPPATRGTGPQARIISSFTHEDRPKDVKTKMYYDGGQEDGDGTKEPQAWSFTKEKGKSVVGIAELGFVVGDIFYEVRIRCKSELDKSREKINYELTVSLTEASHGDLDTGLVGLRWTPLLTEPGALKFSEYDIKRNVFPLALRRLSKQEKPRPMVFSAAAGADPAVMKGSIQIVHLKATEAKKSILAQAPMLVVQKASRKE